MRTFLAISLLWVLTGCGEVDTKTLKEMNQPAEVSTMVEVNQTIPKVELLKEEQNTSTPQIPERHIEKASDEKRLQEQPVESVSVSSSTPNEKSVANSNFTFAKTFGFERPGVVAKAVEDNSSIHAVPVQQTYEGNISTIVPVVSTTSDAKTLPENLPSQRSEKYTKTELEYQAGEHKFELALKEIQQKIELAKMDKELKAEIAKYEKEKREILKEQAVHQANMQTQSEIEIAKYSMESVKAQEETKQLIESQNHKLSLETQKQEMALAAQEVSRDEVLEKERLAFYKIVAIVAGIVIVLFLLIFFFLKRRAEDRRLKMQENELSQQLQIKMIEQQGRNIEKMLEIVASGKELPKNVEKELLGTIKESQKKTLIFEEKPRRSLIFRK